MGFQEYQIICCLHNSTLFLSERFPLKLKIILRNLNIQTDCDHFELVGQVKVFQLSPLTFQGLYTSMVTVCYHSDLD